MERIVPTEIDKAYAAGIFDGEGCVMIHKPRRGRGAGLMATMAQRAPGAMQWLQARWGGSLIESARHLQDREPFSVWYWRLSTQQAAQFLSDVLPHLILKREQAEVAIEFQSRKRNGRRLTADVLEADEAYRLRLQSIRAKDFHP